MKKKAAIILSCIAVVACICVIILVNGSKDKKTGNTGANQKETQSGEQINGGDDKDSKHEIDADDKKEEDKTSQTTDDKVKPSTGDDDNAGSQENAKDPVVEPTKALVTEAVAEPTKEPTKEPASEPTNEPTKEPTKEPTAPAEPFNPFNPNGEEIVLPEVDF